MKIPIVFICAVLIIEACISCGAKHEKSPYEEMCKNVLNNLYDSNYENLLENMDDIFVQAAKSINIDSTLAKVTNRMRRDYSRPIKLTFISSERTVYEKFPATFLIFKIESKDKFGYYFFYVNDLSKKILLVSEFSTAKQKG